MKKKNISVSIGTTSTRQPMWLNCGVYTATCKCDLLHCAISTHKIAVPKPILGGGLLPRLISTVQSITVQKVYMCMLNSIVPCFSTACEGLLLAYWSSAK